MYGFVQNYLFLEIRFWTNLQPIVSSFFKRILLSVSSSESLVVFVSLVPSVKDNYNMCRSQEINGKIIYEKKSATRKKHNVMITWIVFIFNISTSCNHGRFKLKWTSCYSEKETVKTMKLCQINVNCVIRFLTKGSSYLEIHLLLGNLSGNCLV